MGCKYLLSILIKTIDRGGKLSILTLLNTLNSRAKDDLHCTSIKRRYIVDVSLTISSLYRQL